MSIPQGWEGILEEGETILWQGRPVTGVRLRDFLGLPLVFGLFFTGFSLVWIAMARLMTQGEDFSVFPLFGLPFLLVGLYVAFGLPFGKDYLRKRSWYTLSDRKAYVATELFGKRRLKAVPYAEMNILELEDGTPGSVTFKREITVSQYTRRNRSGGRSRRSQTTTTNIGFERIEDARTVYRMIAARRDPVRAQAAQG
ncbi:MAG: aspartate carbamoyltransferase catalytic subunit [Proteobacteria bacterium]|nr:aspartate carbamoyltransferase catalytic subunit [Pseudomonadota bacterium]